MYVFEQAKRSGPHLALAIPTSCGSGHTVPLYAIANVYVYVFELQKEQLCGCGSGVPDLSRLGEPFQKPISSN